MAETLAYKTIVLERPLYFVMFVLMAFLSSYIIWYFVHRARRGRASGVVRGAALAERSTSSGGTGGFAALMAAVMIVFFAQRFYREFHAVELRPDGIRLLYPWPRPPVTILKRDVEEVRLVQAKRKRFLGLGSMEIVSRDHVYVTDRLHNFEEAAEVKEALGK